MGPKHREAGDGGGVGGRRPRGTTEAHPASPWLRCAPAPGVGGVQPQAGRICVPARDASPPGPTAATRYLLAAFTPGLKAAVTLGAGRTSLSRSRFWDLTVLLC